MAAQVDPRDVETARFRVGETAPDQAKTLDPETPSIDPDNEATDLTLDRIDALQLLPSNPRLRAAALLQDEATLRGLPTESEARRVEDVELADDRATWQINGLGAVLLTALICAIAICGVLGIKLSRARAELAAARAEADDEASAPDQVGQGQVDKPAAIAAPVAEAKIAAPEKAAEPSLAAQEAARASVPVLAHQQLILLQTVGAKNLAEKQVRDLKAKCGADLAVYRQARGRCKFEHCFVVAVPASEAESVRGCGRARDQQLRDRDDFTLP